MTTSVVRTQTLTSGPTCFLLIGCLSSNNYKLASANQLGKEGLVRDNTIAYSGRKQVISEMLESSRDMKGKSQFPKHIRVSWRCSSDFYTTTNICRKPLL